MKIYKNILAGTLAVLLAGACDDGYTDPISAVAPGEDVTAPVVKLNYPIQGTKVQVREDVAPLNIQFEATDDIEVESVILELDGTQIANLSGFKDYRRALDTYTYATLNNGDHTLTITAKDISGKSSSSSVDFVKVEPYQPVFDHEIFYMPFDGEYMELVSITNATKVGLPTFSDEAIAGKAYAGANGGYLTFPAAGITKNEFSAAFWYNINAAPDRAGILTIGPPDPNLPATPNNRKNGFRLFREGGATNQNIQVNVGDGAGDSWFNGGAASTFNPATTDWIHIAFTISDTKVVLYMNGVMVNTGAFAGVDWTGCDIFSIASGAPRFMEWNHLSDASLIDELRIFDKAISAEEVVEIMNH